MILLMDIKPYHNGERIYLGRSATYFHHLPLYAALHWAYYVNVVPETEPMYSSK